MDRISVCRYRFDCFQPEYLTIQISFLQINFFMMQLEKRSREQKQSGLKRYVLETHRMNNNSLTEHY